MVDAWKIEKLSLVDLAAGKEMPFSWFDGSAVIFKVFAFFLAWIVLWLPLAVPLAVGLQWRPTQPLEMAKKLPLLASLYAVVPFVLWGAAQIEGIPLSSYGLSSKFSVLSSLSMGLGLGILGLTLLFGIQLSLGWSQWQPSQSQPLRWTLMLTLGLALFVSFIEEWIFRGFLVNQLLDAYSIWVSAFVSSLIFALLHLVWEGQATVPQLPGLWLMGMVLFLARWVDGGSLGLAWGLHAGWIWGIASLDTAQILQVTGKGPAWMTGLAGKPLAGVLGLLLLLGTGGTLWYF
jgi:hypothetical protein